MSAWFEKTRATAQKNVKSHAFKIWKKR